MKPSPDRFAAKLVLIGLVGMWACAGAAWVIQEIGKWLSK